MGQLSNEDIKFIDNYLQKSDIVFVDVRAELTDHVASAVEEKMEIEDVAFYDAFKDFMVCNKKEILKPKNYFLHSLLNFGKTLYKPYSICIALFITVTFYLAQVFEQEEFLKTIHTALFCGIFILSFIQLAYTAVYKKRFIYIERVTFSLLVIYYVNLFFNGFYRDFYGNYISLGITVFLFLAFLVHYIDTIINFKRKYSYL